MNLHLELFEVIDNNIKINNFQCLQKKQLNNSSVHEMLRYEAKPCAVKAQYFVSIFSWFPETNL